MSCISLIHSSSQNSSQKFILLISEQKIPRSEVKQRREVNHVHETLRHQQLFPQIYIIIISKAKQKTKTNFP